MLDKIKARGEKELKEWYDSFFSEHGTWPTTPKYNNTMLNYLEVPLNKNKKLLDVACGGGRLLEQAEKRVASYGIDISRSALKEAIERVKNSFLCMCSAEKLPFKEGTFDFITCLGSLEHFLNMNIALREMKRVLKDDGLINICVPNTYYIMNLLGVYKTGSDPNLEQINERFATNAEWQKLLEDNGFEIIKVYGVEPHPVKFKYIIWNLIKGNFADLTVHLIRKIHIPLNFAYCFSYIVKKRCVNDINQKS